MRRSTAFVSATTSSDFLKAVEGVQRVAHNRHVPTIMKGMTLHVEGLRWHDPISVVGARSRSECYGVVAPPRSWGRGIRNAAHCTPSTAFLNLCARYEFYAEYL